MTEFVTKRPWNTKIANCIVKIHFWRFYRNSIDRGTEYDVDAKTHNLIISDYFRAKMEKLTTDGVPFTLHGLGDIEITKHKMSYSPTKLRMNFPHYLKTGEKTYYLNEHTNGYRYRFYFRKLTSKCAFLKVYRIRIKKSWRMVLSKKLFAGEFDVVMKGKPV